MDNWVYSCHHTNCLSLKNRNNQANFSFHDSGRFQADQITVNSGPLENVQDLVSDSFDSLRPISHKKGFGLLGNEVEQLFPNLVVGCDGSQSIDYNQLVTLCIKEIQNLKKKINELEGISTPCSVISSADFTLDTVYLNNALLGPTGLNPTASFIKTSFTTGGADIIPGPTGEVGPTGTTI